MSSSMAVQGGAVSNANIVEKNVLAARAMYENVNQKFKLDIVQNIAQEMFLRAVELMAQAAGTTLDTLPDMVPVMLELRCVSGHELIQTNLSTLIPVLKAHRAFTELAWVQCWKEKVQQPIYTKNRDELIQIANAVKSVLPKTNKMEPGILLSAVGARYEASCLREAAKCLAPSEAIWKQFIAPTAAAVGAAATKSIGSLVNAMIQIETIVQKEWLSEWYLDLFPLEWISTTITTQEVFNKEIGPKLPIFKDKGRKYSIGLVKILSLIFLNKDTQPVLKQRVLQELIELLKLKPDYTLTGFFQHPDQLIDKLLKNPDRYAKTRSFAAWALFDIALRAEHKEWRPQIKEAINEWKIRVQDKTTRKYVDEKKEAQARATAFIEEIATLDKALNKLSDDLGILAMGVSRSDVDLDEDQLNQQIDEGECLKEEKTKELEVCKKVIKIGEAFAQVDKEEESILDQIANVMENWAIDNK